MSSIPSDCDGPPATSRGAPQGPPSTSRGAAPLQVPPANAALVLREVLWDPCAGAYTYQFANWAEGLGFVLWDMVPASEWQNQPMLYSVGRMGGVSRLLRHCSHLTFRLRIEARGRRSIYEYDWYGMVTSFRLPVGTPPQPHRGAFPSTAPGAPLAQSPVVSPTPEERATHYQ